MKKSGLFSKLRDGFYTGLTASAIALGALTNYNCSGENPMEPNPPGPGPNPMPEVVVSQTARQYGDIGIIWRGTYENTDEATRRVLYNGVQQDSLTKTMTTSSAADTLQNRFTGDWTFILEAKNAKPDTTEVSIPDYNSQAPDLSQLELNLDKNGETVTAHLPRATDKNLEQNPVKYTSVTSPDGKTTATIGAFPNDTVLSVTPVEDATGPYQLELEFEGNNQPVVFQREIFETPPPPQPTLSQTLNQYGQIGLINSVTFENISQATGNVYHNGVLQDSLTRTVTTSPFEYTLETLVKGTWDFVWSAEGITPNTVTGSIADYAPQPVQAFFNNLQTNMNEGSQLSFDLTGSFTDVNVEDNPVPITSAVSLDGKTQPTLNGNQLEIQALDQNTGAYQVQVTANGLTSEVIQGELFDLPRIQGRIEDATTDLGMAASLWIYDTATNALLRETQTDANGNYDIMLSNPVSEIMIKARLNSGIPDSNFVRTRRIPGTDLEDFLMRPFPYTLALENAGISPDSFLVHNAILNPTFLKSKADSVELVDVDPLGRGSLDLDFMQLVRDKILDSDDIGCYVPGRQLYVQIDDVNSERHYSIIDGEIVPNPGWIVVTRDTISGGASTNRIDDYSFLIKTDPQTEGVIAHEFGHVFIAPSTDHSPLNPQTQTILNAGAPSRSTPGPADCEVAKVISEETYIASESPLNEIYPDILLRNTTP